MKGAAYIHLRIRQTTLHGVGLDRPTRLGEGIPLVTWSTSLCCLGVTWHWTMSRGRRPFPPTPHYLTVVALFLRPDQRQATTFVSQAVFVSLHTWLSVCHCVGTLVMYNMACWGDYWHIQLPMSCMCPRYKIYSSWNLMRWQVNFIVHAINSIV